MSQNKRPPSFKIEVPGDVLKKESIMQRMQLVKNHVMTTLNRPVNNWDVFDAMLTNWCDNNGKKGKGDETFGTASYAQVKREDTCEDLFVVASSSLQRLVTMTGDHARNCNDELKIVKTVYRGHVIINTLQCTKEKNPHIYKWSSSPYLPNNEYLVNHRINHAIVCSGMLPVNYTRFANTANLGCISRSNRKRMTDLHSASVKSVYESSLEDALLEEVAFYEDLDGIEIMTDARHGWRKNSKDSSVIAIGEKTHKVLQCINISKHDDIVSQRHEKVGTDKMYNYFDNKDVSIKVHTHDRNMTINKMVKGKINTTNQNDLWHSVKSVKKMIASVASGPKYKEGSTWSEQLADKVEPVATHFHWAIRNCDKDPQILKTLLGNIVSHYKNEHSMCHNSSRCKKDPNYEPSRTVITDPMAEKLLRMTIENSVIYKNPEDYILGRDTSYVESFNNVMNVFQDKRIVFSEKRYCDRSNLSVLHWNENVDREFTSVWNKKDQQAPRRQKGKKNYKSPTFNYRNSVWEIYMNSIFKRSRKQLH